MIYYKRWRIRSNYAIIFYNN
ncbi:MAG: hypothetical protein A370_00638, partial [Clostridium sp. Maddingley MBC34-26]